MPKHDLSKPQIQIASPYQENVTSFRPAEDKAKRVSPNPFVAYLTKSREWYTELKTCVTRDPSESALTH